MEARERQQLAQGRPAPRRTAVPTTQQAGTAHSRPRTGSGWSALRWPPPRSPLSSAGTGSDWLSPSGGSASQTGPRCSRPRTPVGGREGAQKGKGLMRDLIHRLGVTVPGLLQEGRGYGLRAQGWSHNSNHSIYDTALRTERQKVYKMLSTGPITQQTLCKR